jgi:glycosyltransferase involved in cell wall biosynthesis
MIKEVRKMDILKNKMYIKKSKKVYIKKIKNILKIKNDNNSPITVIIPQIYRCNKECLQVDFYGNVIKGSYPLLKIINRHKKIVKEINLNSENYICKNIKFFMLAIRVMPNSQIEINDISVDYLDSYHDKIVKHFTGDTLLISPGYPDVINKYSCGFVHTRVKEYLKSNWNIDVAITINSPGALFYNYEGVNVCKISNYDLRELLQNKHYNKILIHFFNDTYANILDATDISKTKVYLYSHGADTMYRDFNKMTAIYFNPVLENSQRQENYFKYRDSILRAYNNNPNIKWVFVTDWTKKHSEELNNIKYKNSITIPCFVDENTFHYEKKSPELRKKIFIIRKFDNINSYSIDIDVRVILELSRRSFFNDLEFNIYGDGSEHEILLAPIKKFKNVNIYKKFLSHKEIAKAHKENGIALFATRYDSQAVSSCEAAMSGLVVISSNNTGVYQEINPEYGTLCETENYIEYADKIEELYYNEKKFLDLSEKMHNFVFNKYGYEQTIAKELKMFENEDKNLPFISTYPEQDKDILLTVVIPAYNVEKFLKNGVFSLINHELANKLEILIINDGSKDKTSEIAKQLEELTKVNGKSIVQLINKENGGHGSTINTGIKLARGKYFKLMDGDDYFNTEEFVKLIKILENQDADIVLNNYIEDYSESAIKKIQRIYDFMIPNIKYNLDDLCYDGYGFKQWGPLLSTATYKTEILKNGKFELTENCFYVDMEFNLNTFINANTIIYYPLNIYNYYIGRNGQSISKEALIKNISMHRRVIINLIKTYYNKLPKISENKQAYLKKKIINKMIKDHYDMSLTFFRNGKTFREFDKQLKKFPEFYNDKTIIKKNIKFNRLTKGHLVLLRFPARLLKKVLKKDI